MTKMNNTSKLSEGWVTNFKHNPFLKARIKLSAYYCAGILILIVILNLGIYGLFVSDVPDKFESKLPPQERDIIDQAGDRLEIVLLITDSLMIILSIAFGYYFAGKTLKPIEISYKKQKTFIADAAHELRTPLTVMKTGAETILSGESDKQKYRKLIQDSLGEIDFLSGLVDDLLFLSRNDAIKNVVFEKLDLGKLAQQQIKIMGTYAKSKHIVLAAEIQKEVITDGDKNQLRRLLANLIKNAIDYNKPLGMVVLTVKQTRELCIIKVADTGNGIANEDLPYVFDRFYKADSSRSKSGNSTGLGLPIVQEIVKQHRGTIRIDSEFDKSTIVTITFPTYLHKILIFIY